MLNMVAHGCIILVMIAINDKVTEIAILLARKTFNTKEIEWNPTGS